MWMIGAAPMSADPKRPWEELEQFYGDDEEYYALERRESGEAEDDLGEWDDAQFDPASYG